MDPLQILYPDFANEDAADFGEGTCEGASEGEVYQVEKIVDHTDRDGSREYLVKWKNYSSAHNTWEPEACLKECDDAILEYLATQDAERKVGRNENGIPAEDEKEKNAAAEYLEEKPFGDDDSSDSEDEEQLEKGVYEVERIISHRPTKNGRVFLIKWKGYSLTQTTWEPESSLDGCPLLLDAYLSSNNLKKHDPSKKPNTRRRFEQYKRFVAVKADKPLPRLGTIARKFPFARPEDKISGDKGNQASRRISESPETEDDDWVEGFRSLPVVGLSGVLTFCNGTRFYEVWHNDGDKGLMMPVEKLESVWPDETAKVRTLLKRKAASEEKDTE